MRGYVSGSGWKDYKASGSICGIKLPAGLLESDQLPEPIFTPSTKAELGTHENISFEQMAAVCGRELAEQARDYTIRIYTRARDLAAKKGIIIADTQFEFGVYDGELIIIDECMTPTPAVSGQGFSTSRAGRNPALTNSSCGITWRLSIGAKQPLRRTSRRRSSKNRREIPRRSSASQASAYKYRFQTNYEIESREKRAGRSASPLL